MISVQFRQLLCVVLLSIVPVSAMAAKSRPPKADRFTPVAVPSASSLTQYISPASLKAVRDQIASHKCPDAGMVLYRSPNRNGKTSVLTVRCDPPRGTREPGGRYFEYPLTLLISENRVSEVDLQSHGFMYDSGSIEAITDIDRNDAPEFWLYGDVCECDGEPEDYGGKECDCSGGTVLEFRNGRLHRWKRSSAAKGR